MFSKARPMPTPLLEPLRVKLMVCCSKSIVVPITSPAEKERERGRQQERKRKEGRRKTIRKRQRREEKGGGEKGRVEKGRKRENRKNEEERKKKKNATGIRKRTRKERKRIMK
jgi:hypothetical protein